MSWVQRAESTARTCLELALPRRWTHVRAVAVVAAELSQDLSDDADVLVSAAWLHDVGYASAVAHVGFHRDYRAAHSDKHEANTTDAAAIPTDWPHPIPDPQPGLWDDETTGQLFDDQAPDEEVVPVVGEWRFLGLGYTTPGDALLAAYEHADHVAALEFLRQQPRT